MIIGGTTITREVKNEEQGIFNCFGPFVHPTGLHLEQPERGSPPAKRCRIQVRQVARQAQGVGIKSKGFEAGNGDGENIESSTNTEKQKKRKKSRRLQ